LTAISTGEVVTTDYTATKEQRKVKIYDFRRPDKFSKDQIRTLQMMHETFAKTLQTALLANIKTQIEIKHVAIDNITVTPN
jgi:flagellar motor switch protein FliM